MNWTPEQEFVFRASPLEWLEYAEELWANASLLFDPEPGALTATMDPVRGSAVRPTSSRTYLLLSAFAIENVMKGVAVARQPELVSGGKIAKALETHSITKVADKLAGIQLSKEERDVCEILERAIPSWGRYPVPRTIGSLSQEATSSPDLHAAIGALFHRLREMLNELMKKGWRGPHDMTMAPPETIQVRR